MSLGKKLKEVEKAKRIVFLYEDFCKYSVNALISALDQQKFKKRVILISKKDVFNICNNKDTILAINLNTVWLVENLGFIKKIEKLKCIKIAGGSHATGDPVGTLNLGFDFVFIGNAEESLAKFLNGKLSRGIAWKEENYYWTGKPKKVDINNFFSFPFWRGLFSPIEIQRGCNFNCKYCETPFIHGNSSFRTIESIVKHYNALCDKKKKFVRFITPNAFGYPWFEELIEEARKRRLKIFIGSFPSEVRPEFVTEEKLEFIKGKIENKRIIIGGQYGNDRILKLINRKHSVEDVKDAVKLTLKYGFRPEVDFIFGFPFVDYQDIKENLETIYWIIRQGGKIHAHWLLPLPGTEFESLKPKFIKEEFSFLKKLEGKGIVWGEWKKQLEIGRKIAEMYENKIILGKRGYKMLNKFTC